MNVFTKAAVALVTAIALPSFGAQFSVVGLGFEGVQQEFNGGYPEAQVWEFYDGGFSRSEDGLTNLEQGPDYDVVFNSSALAERAFNANGNGPFGPRYLNTQNGPVLDNLGNSALFFRLDEAVLNFANGFSQGFSFYYASTSELTVTLYEGLDGGGALLGEGSFSPTPTCTFDDISYCAWSIGAIAFTGNAQSVRLGGLGSQALFDNVTFGSVLPIDGVIPIPEPSTWALLGAGLLLVAGVARKRAST